MLLAMKKVQKNLSISEDVFQKFEAARDIFGHGNGWAIITSALRTFLDMTPEEQVAAMRSEHDRDVKAKLMERAATIKPEPKRRAGRPKQIAPKSETKTA